MLNQLVEYNGDLFHSNMSYLLHKLFIIKYKMINQYHIRNINFKNPNYD